MLRSSSGLRRKVAAVELLVGVHAEKPGVTTHYTPSGQALYKLALAFTQTLQVTNQISICIE